MLQGTHASWRTRQLVSGVRRWWPSWAVECFHPSPQLPNQQHCHTLVAFLFPQMHKEELFTKLQPQGSHIHMTNSVLIPSFDYYSSNFWCAISRWDAVPLDWNWWKMISQLTGKNPQLLDLWKTSTTSLHSPNLRLTLNSSSITPVSQGTRQSKLSSSSWAKPPALHAGTCWLRGWNIQLSAINGWLLLKNIRDLLWREQQSLQQWQDKTQNIHGSSKAKVTCLSGWWKWRDSPGDGKHLTWWSIFPSASTWYHLGLFLLPLLALTCSQPYALSHSFCSSCAWRKKLMLEGSFCSTEGQVCCSVPYTPAGLLTPSLHHSFAFLNRDHRILKDALITPSALQRFSSDL